MEFRFTDPATDFSHGLAVIRCYHDDLLATGEDLLKLAIRVQHRGVDEATAYRCMALFSHYQLTNPLHHRDEENCLFPLLLEHSLLMDAMLERLTLDHEEIETWWDELAKMLAAPEQVKDGDRFMELAYTFERLQREHLVRENQDFLPEVEKLLKPAQIRAVGLKMAALRGISGIGLGRPSLALTLE